MSSYATSTAADADALYRVWSAKTDLDRKDAELEAKEKELDEIRRLNVQLSKHLVDCLSKISKLKKELGELENKLAQKEMGV
jgi:predicted nuclease with TOPRIM domain